MKKILVPCDFSKPARSALRFAVNVATQSKGTIHLLNVVELPIMHDTMLMPVLNFEEALLQELREKAGKRFAKIREQYKSSRIKITSEVRFGSVAQMIVDTIREQNIDIVIMGSHGASGVRELFVGSNAEKIVRLSPVPVLIVKDQFKGTIKNIVFPMALDSNTHEDITMKVKALQSFFKAKLHIVWINTPLNFTPDIETRKKLQDFAKRYMLKDYTINVFNSRDEEQGILAFASTVKADLIALGTHSRKGIAHLISGSLAEELVNHDRGLVWTYTLKNEKKLAKV